MDEQLLREFLAEADERIEVMFADIERLRRVHTDADGRVRRELVARIFRHVHTLKGSAATLPQLAPVSRLAHELENLLDAVRSGRAALTNATIEICEDATHALSLLLQSAAQGDAASTTPELPHAIFNKLRQHAGLPRTFIDGGADTGAHSPVADLPEEIARALSGVEQRHLGESLKEGGRVMLVAAAFDLMTLDEDFTRFTDALGACGEIISTFPGDPSGAPDEISFRLLYTTTCTQAELEKHLTPFGATVAWTTDAALTGDADAHAKFAETSAWEDDPLYMKPDGANVATSPVVAATSLASNFVRVPLRELDELVTATHELFTDTLAVLEQTPASDAPARADEATHAERTRSLRENFSALEERVMSLRMQPLMPVLERAARSARIAARAAGKEIEMEVAGGEVRVDRSLAEQVGEPLLHLLRNAIDHGIETTEERRAAGKPERGHVRLDVAAEGSRVRVRVADDGRGIDTERIARVAIAQGLLEAGAQITDAHALRLIFRPGFSTAGRVSDVSGRGVGLDVVEHALERAGGELRVRSVRGEGTTFELRAPLTLALMPVVIVRANGHAYAIDASYVIETGRLEATALAFDDAGRGSALWRGRPLPFVSLGALLEGATAEMRGGANERFPIILARRERTGTGGGTKGDSDPEPLIIAVDNIEGEREALVRSLGRHATRWRGVSGAFQQRDGTVALLLDLPRLLERIEAVGDESG